MTLYEFKCKTVEGVCGLHLTLEKIKEDLFNELDSIKDESKDECNSNKTFETFLNQTASLLATCFKASSDIAGFVVTNCEFPEQEKIDEKSLSALDFETAIILQQIQGILDRLSVVAHRFGLSIDFGKEIPDVTLYPELLGDFLEKLGQCIDTAYAIKNFTEAEALKTPNDCCGCSK